MTSSFVLLCNSMRAFRAVDICSALESCRAEPAKQSSLCPNGLQRMREMGRKTRKNTSGAMVSVCVCLRARARVCTACAYAQTCTEAIHICVHHGHKSWTGNQSGSEFSIVPNPYAFPQSPQLCGCCFPHVHGGLQMLGRRTLFLLSPTLHTA